MPPEDSSPAAYILTNSTYFACSFNSADPPPLSPLPPPLHYQVALLVIMAQAGSLVPAELMSLSPMDRLFTRMGTGDCIETNSSSFMMEMQVWGMRRWG